MLLYLSRHQTCEPLTGVCVLRAFPDTAYPYIGVCWREIVINNLLLHPPHPSLALRVRGAPTLSSPASSSLAIRFQRCRHPAN